MVPAIAAWHLPPRASPAYLLSRDAPGRRRSCACLQAAAALVVHLWSALRRRRASCQICVVSASWSSLLAPLFGGVPSLEDCNLGAAKRNPGPRTFDAATCATIVVRAFAQHARRRKFEF